MREPIEHWVSNWPGKQEEDNPEPRKKVTSCTNCEVGTSCFIAGPKLYLCEDCVGRWYPNLSATELTTLMDKQAEELVRVKA